MTEKQKKGKEDFDPRKSVEGVMPKGKAAEQVRRASAELDLNLLKNKIIEARKRVDGSLKKSESAGEKAGILKTELSELGEILRKLEDSAFEVNVANRVNSVQKQIEKITNKFNELNKRLVKIEGEITSTEQQMKHEQETVIISSENEKGDELREPDLTFDEEKGIFRFVDSETGAEQGIIIKKIINTGATVKVSGNRLYITGSGDDPRKIAAEVYPLAGFVDRIVVKIFEGDDSKTVYDAAASAPGFFSPATAKGMLEKYFVKDKPAVKIEPAATPDKIDNLASRAPTVMKAPEPEPEPEPQKEPIKTKAEKFVLENGVARVGDIAIDLSALANNENYKVTITDNASVRIEDLRKKGKQKAIFQFDPESNKIAFKPMDRGREYDTMTLGAGEVEDKLKILFPELKGEKKNKKVEEVREKENVVSPFKLEGENLSTANFTWDLHNILDGGQCEVVIDDDIVVFQGKEKLKNIKIKVRLTEKKDEVEMKKEVNGKQEFDDDYKLKNALHRLEMTFAVRKKVEVKENEPAKDKKSSVDTRRPEYGIYDRDSGEEILSEKNLQSLVDLMKQTDDEELINWATSLSVGLPQEGDEDYEMKGKRKIYKKRVFNEDLLRETYDRTVKYFQEMFGDNMVERVAAVKGADKNDGNELLFLRIADLLGLKKEKKFSAENAAKYGALRNSALESLRRLNATLDNINIRLAEISNSMKDLSEKNRPPQDDAGNIKPVANRFDTTDEWTQGKILISKYNEYSARAKQLLSDATAFSADIDAVDSDEKFDKFSDEFGQRDKNIKEQVDLLNNDFDAMDDEVALALAHAKDEAAIEKLNEAIGAVNPHADTLPSTPPPAPEGEPAPEINTEKEKIAEALKSRAPEINAIVREYAEYAAPIRTVLPDYYMREMIPDSELAEMIFDKFEKIINESTTVEEANGKVDELLKHHAEYMDELKAKVQEKMNAASPGEEFTFGGATVPATPSAEADSSAYELRTGTLPESEVIPAKEKKSFLGKIKGFFGGAKEKGATLAELAVNPEVRKVALGALYRATSSAFGVKLGTDLFGFLAGKFISEKIGFGDIHKYRVSAGDIKNEKSEISKALQEIMANGDNIEDKIQNLREKISASKHISPQDRDQMEIKLVRVAESYRTAAEDAVKERDKKISALFETYMKNKVAKTVFVKDALDGLFTVAGLSAARLGARTVLKVGGRLMKAENERMKIENVGEAIESAGKYYLNDLKNAFVETARGLALQGAKEGANRKQKAVDFARAAGTVATAFGIFGLAITDDMSPGEAANALVEKVQEQGIMCAVGDNFVNNASRVAQLYTSPIDTIGHRFGYGEDQPMNANDLLVAQGAGVHEQAVAVPIADQISPDLQAHLDKFGDNQTLREAFLSEVRVHGNHDLDKIADAYVVHKGDGLERIIQRQLLLDPEKFGLHDPNIINDPDKLQHWAGHEARVIALKNHIDDKYFVYDAKHPQYLVVDENKNVIYETKQLHTETEAMRAHRAGVETKPPVEGELRKVFELKPGHGEVPKMLTDIEQAEYDRLYEVGDYEGAMDYHMQHAGLGQVYEMPDGTQTHEQNLTFDSLTREGAAPVQEGVAGGQSVAPAAEHTTNISPASAEDRAADRSAAIAERNLRNMESADSAAIEPAESVVEGTYAEAKFERANDGTITNMVLEQRATPLDLGIFKKAMLAKGVDIGADTKVLQKFSDLGSADDLYKQMLSRGESNSDEAEYLRGETARQMTELSKLTGRDRSDLFKVDVLRKYGFNDDASHAESVEIANRNADL